jgi:hypothetical protein
MPVPPITISNNVGVLFPKCVYKPFGQKIGLKWFSFFVCEASTFTIPLDKKVLDISEDCLEMKTLNKLQWNWYSLSKIKINNVIETRSHIYTWAQACTSSLNTADNAT